MIYSNNKHLVLTEDAADAFLESVGVELFEDSIGIDGTLYEGTYGESILEANGIYLYEDGIVLEGQQAEEYKARKAKEKADAKKAEDDRYTRRHANNSGYYNTGDRFAKHPDRSPIIRNTYRDGDNDLAVKNYGRTIGADGRRNMHSNLRSLRAKYGQFEPLPDKDVRNIADTYNRHIRRHPKQYDKRYNESSIFSDIDII